MVYHHAEQETTALHVAIEQIQQLAENLKDNSEAFVLARRAALLLEACLLEIQPRFGQGSFWCASA